MGIKNSPDIFQQLINNVLGDIENVRAYLDDILIMTSGLYEDHLANLDKVLCCLHDAGFAVNVRKSSFAEDAIKYLGYCWITCEGIQPQPKKVEVIQ